MIRARWRNRIGTRSMLLGAALIVTAAISASAAIASPGRQATDRTVSCPNTPIKAAAAARRATPSRSIEAITELRLTPRGELFGRRLRFAGVGAEAPVIELPVESFVGQRSADAVVYTRSGGGRGSEVHLVDVATGCDSIVARPSEIVRSAILDGDASSIYVHGVTRSGRRDAGVIRHDLKTGSQTPVVPALAGDTGLGPIHGTELRWSLGGNTLTVQSCGFAECLSRVLDVASGGLVTIDRPGQGALIGTTDTALVTFDSCPGMPCAVLSHDLATGSSRVVADEAYGVSLAVDALGRTRISIDTAAGEREAWL